MVKDTGAAQGPGGVRPLGLPRPIEVRTDRRGWPVALKLDRRWAPVTVEDRWRIDDEWWREEPTSRFYYRVTSANAQAIIIYHNPLLTLWFKQSMGAD